MTASNRSRSYPLMIAAAIACSAAAIFPLKSRLAQAAGKGPEAVPDTISETEVKADVQMRSPQRGDRIDADAGRLSPGAGGV